MTIMKENIGKTKDKDRRKVISASKTEARELSDSKKYLIEKRKRVIVGRIIWEEIRG